MVGQGVKFGSSILVSLFLISTLLHVMPVLAFDRQLNIDNQTLYLNGEGPRKKAFLTLYDIALYLTEQGSDAKAILEADHPMAVSLVVRSRFTTAERISEAFSQGLINSTGGDITSIQSQSDAFLSVFSQGVVKDDAFEFFYQPQQGVHIYKNSVLQSVVPGLAFKQALFGIWLSTLPVSNKLKAQLLERQ